MSNEEATISLFGPDYWFGFVESVDPFVAPSARAPTPVWWERVLTARTARNLAAPDRIVWLSCIRAQYFVALPWREEPCEIGDERQGDRRRERLLSFDPTELTIVGLLLDTNNYDERSVAAEAEGHDWLRFTLGASGALPVVIGPDFRFGQDAPLTGLDHWGGVTESELVALRAVFNLDFLPDAELGGEQDNEPPTPARPPEPGEPPRPVDWPVVYQRLKKKWQA